MTSYQCPDGWTTTRQDNENGYCSSPVPFRSGAPRVFFFGPQAGGYPLNRRNLTDYQMDSYEQQISAYTDRSPTWPPVPHPALIAPPPAPPAPPPPPPNPPTAPSPPPPAPEPKPITITDPSILIPGLGELSPPLADPDKNGITPYIPFIIGGVLLYILFF